MSVFGSCLLIFGPEGLFAERAARQRIREALEERPGSQVNRVEAGDLDGNLFAEITGGSLLSSDSVTVISDIGSTPPELADALLSVALAPPPELVLILVHGGGVKGKGLLDKLKKAKLERVEATALKPWEAPSFVVSEARAQRVRMGQEAAQALVAAVGTDPRALAAAVDQLRADTEGAEITERVIATYFAGRAEVSSFMIADAALAGNIPLALERLRWALGTGVAAVLITSALASSLRGLGRYLDARTMRLRDADLARQIGVPPFKLKDLHRSSRGWTPEGVSAAVRAVAGADAPLQGAAADPHYSLGRRLRGAGPPQPGGAPPDPDYALERMLLAVVTQRRSS
ncbi:MAG: DNA polymerase III subunit delta [Propionibacteriaceae bacterium]|nr:DNA polymerase III subunit delta [Propionibacteriaceae bacterium]